MRPKTKNSKDSAISACDSGEQKRDSRKVVETAVGQKHLRNWNRSKSNLARETEIHNFHRKKLMTNSKTV